MIPLVATLALVASAEPTRRIALLVGDNDGGPSRTTLRYAHRDADQMASVMQDLGGVQAEDAIVLYDPTKAELLAAFDQVNLELEADRGSGEFLFYYSGHSDEEGLLLGSDVLQYRELKSRLDTLPARVRLGILDSCASGSMILTKGGKPVPAFLGDESIQVDGSAYITSSADDEVSQEAERISGSYFTHYLASGLRGAADATGDGRVTLEEAYGYAYDETLAQTEKTQHGPQHAMRTVNLTGKGELVLTDLALTTASLVLDESLAGRALIRDAEGHLVIELRKIAGRPVELGLAEGPYTVTIVNGDDQYGSAAVTLSNGASVRLAATELDWQMADPTVARGDVPAVPPAAVVSGPDEPRRLWPRFALLPGVFPHPEGVDSFVVSAVASDSTALRGTAVSMGAHWVTGRADGTIAAMGFTSAGELHGLELSMGANVVTGAGTGSQLTMGANVTGDQFQGFQGSMGANVANGDVRGLQATMGGNIAIGALRGVQLTTGFNWAGPDSVGTQLASVNIARDLRGAQIGGVNVGTDVRGFQLGLVNIGRDVHGTQIGLINVARDVKGVPIGLLSFEKEGRHDFQVYASESDLFNVDLKLGGDYVHTVLGGGGNAEHAYTSFGFGAHLPSDHLWMDVDLVQTAYIKLGTTTLADGELSGPFSRPPTGVVRLRGVVGLQVAKEFAPFAGASMNFRIPGNYRLVDVAPDLLVGPDEDVIAWPGLFAGVQF
ncbi:MAG: caspase family protein [Myxococcota bacterium]